MFLSCLHLCPCHFNVLVKVDGYTSRIRLPFYKGQDFNRRAFCFPYICFFVYVPPIGA